MGASYWAQVVSNRLTRRRAIGTGAALTAGAAALLAGCGSGGKGEQKSAPSNEGRVIIPKDTSAEAKKGGIFQNQIEGDELNLDPLSTGRGNGGWTSELSYSRPFIE